MTKSANLGRITININRSSLLNGLLYYHEVTLSVFGLYQSDLTLPSPH